MAEELVKEEFIPRQEGFFSVTNRADQEEDTGPGTEKGTGGKQEHSVPVPQLYKEAVKILKSYENKQGSLKNLVFNSKYRNYKTMYGLVCKAVANAATIKAALADCNIFTEQPKFNPSLAHVLTAELLRKGHLDGDCKPVLVLNQYAEKMKQLVGSSIVEGSSPYEETEKNPRYVRINTLLSTVDRVHAQLARDGWTLMKYDASQTTYDEFLEYIQNMDEGCYVEDYHIPGLLLFPHGTPFWDNNLYKNHIFVLQDKASCLPVFLSNLKPGAHVIDACAAPGNKTSFMAASMDNIGKISAVDKNDKRYKLLQKCVSQRGASCVKCIKCDFTAMHPDENNDVEYIFVDPSCSSSGADFHDDKVPQDRVKKLATFQVMLLLHALSFTSVQKVVYSTCSVNVEENEAVVEEALKKYGDKFYLQDLGKQLPGWKHFGKTNFESAGMCIRTVKSVDRCEGFFVAIFIRKDTKPMKKKLAAEKYGSTKYREERVENLASNRHNEGTSWNDANNEQHSWSKNSYNKRKPWNNSKPNVKRTKPYC